MAMLCGDRSRRSWVVLLLVAALLWPVLPAEAVEVRAGDAERLLGQTSIQRLDIRLSGGSRARGEVVRFRANDPAVRLEPRLARDTAVGLETMATMSRRETPRGALAGVNGGYFLPGRQGVPNGLFVDRTALIAGESVSRTGLPAGRAVLGIAPDGGLLGDRLKVTHELDLPSTAEVVGLDDVNRQPLTTSTGQVTLYTDRYGATVEVPAASTVLVLEGARLPSAGRVETVVRDRFVPTTTRGFAPADGTMLLVADGVRAGELAAVTPGTVVGLTTSILPETTDPSRWAGLRGAVPGGGLLLLDGQVSSGTVMAAEGLNHASTRRARTVVGWTAAGQVMLVAIDETDDSSGVTLFEAALVLRELGAESGVALDGGGSTTMVVGGAVRNRPSQPARSHSSALFLYTDPPPPSRSLDSACPAERVPGARFTDTVESVHAAAIDCLAWWGVTTGRTADRFVPTEGATRAQMASFLAHWLDDIAERGSGVALPAEAELTFDDVRDDDVHAGAIARLAAAEIIRGRTTDAYDPGAQVSRAETATLLRRAVEYSTGTELPGARDTFLDDNRSVHEASIDRFAAAGVVGGTGGFSFDPDEPLSRAAMASLLMRSSALLTDRGVVTPPV